MREKTSHQIMMISLLCIFELALSLLIIKYVSYTEIDWIAYGEEVDGFFKFKEYDYRKLGLTRDLWCIQPDLSTVTASYGG